MFNGKCPNCAKEICVLDANNRVISKKHNFTPVNIVLKKKNGDISRLSLPVCDNCAKKDLGDLFARLKRSGASGTEMYDSNFEYVRTEKDE